MGSRDIVGDDDNLCDLGQQDCGGESKGVRQALEFQETDGPIQLPKHNPTTFEDFSQTHQQIRYLGTLEQL